MQGSNVKSEQTTNGRYTFVVSVHRLRLCLGNRKTDATLLLKEVK